MSSCCSRGNIAHTQSGLNKRNKKNRQNQISHLRFVLQKKIMWRKSSLLFWGIFLSTQLSTSQAQRFNLDSLRQAAVSQAGSGFACADKDTHFELVTGFVYTAPDDMLDSRPGTLMLTDCIELCRRNVTCKSANFETGLCVLFGSSAEDYPGKKMNI